jgi:PAS domain S-box-containing protein
MAEQPPKNCGADFSISIEKIFGSLTPKNITESREFFQAVLDGIQDSIKIVDEQFRIVYANRASELRSGKQVAELVGKACYSEYYHLDSPCGFCRTSRSFKSGEKEVTGYETVDEAGEPQCFELTSYPIKDEAGQVRFVIEITKDITERKRLERQLLHSERLASMGTLASSLAHEINNPLSVILGFAQDLLTEIPADSPHSQSLRIIEQEAVRCGRVLQRLLHFARAHPPSMTEVNIGSILQSVVELIRPQAKKLKIESRLKVAKNLPNIQGDANQLEQLVLNLALNALQAMPDGGKLTITADEESGRVTIAVADTGVGIENADLPRVFDPFFSRKGVAGTGLGLSICQRIVTEHHGEVRIESEAGKGTRVLVHLPVHG